MLGTTFAVMILGCLAVAAQVLMPRSGYQAGAMAIEAGGAQPVFEFRFPKAGESC